MHNMKHVNIQLHEGHSLPCRCHPGLWSLQIIKDWEVVDDLHVEMQAGNENPHDMTAPGICEGYLLKRRKWPLKGWHKVRSLCHEETMNVTLEETESVSKVTALFFSDISSWKQESYATVKTIKM